MSTSLGQADRVSQVFIIEGIMEATSVKLTCSVLSEKMIVGLFSVCISLEYTLHRNSNRIPLSCGIKWQIHIMAIVGILGTV